MRALIGYSFVTLFVTLDPIGKPRGHLGLPLSFPSPGGARRTDFGRPAHRHGALAARMGRRHCNADRRHALTFLALLVAPRLMRILGVTGANVIGRILGIILAALAAQLVLDGLTQSGMR